MLTMFWLIVLSPLIRKIEQNHRCQFNKTPFQNKPPDGRIEVSRRRLVTNSPSMELIKGTLNIKEIVDQAKPTDKKVDRPNDIPLHTRISGTRVGHIALLVIGFGIGAFLTIAVTQWEVLNTSLSVSLLTLCVTALFVGIFSLLGKDYETNTKENYRANENLGIVIGKDSNESTNQHQSYAEPFHKLPSLIVRILSRMKRGKQPNGNVTRARLPPVALSKGSD